jgi:hypothetical protein
MSRGSRIDRKWSGSGLDSPPSLPRMRTRSRTTSSPTSNRKIPPPTRRSKGAASTRSTGDARATAPDPEVPRSHLLQPLRDSSPPPRNPRCESCQTSRRNGHREIREMADVAKGLIETSPLFGAHTPPPPPLAAGVAGGGARRSTNRLRIAGPAHERETLETGWECKMIEMNGMGMRGDRNERARFPKFEQSLLTSGHASEWTARALRPERSGRAGGSAAQVYGSAEMGGFVSACCNKVFAFKLNNL